MKTDERLTILLTLKGRDLCTLRWLWYANRIKLPFPIFIADGEVNPIVAQIIEDKRVFPNLRIEYHKYSDLTFQDFYNKLKDAISKIKTPYIMMSDNDDYLIPSGIIKSINFLDDASDYESAGGGIAHFELGNQKGPLQGLNGKIVRYWFQQSKAYKSYDLASQHIENRVLEAYSGFLTVCYNVFRASTLQKIITETSLLNFQRLDNAELYLILRSATLGKVKSDSFFISYIRQLGTSSNPSRGKDFIESLIAEPYLEEIQKIVNKITKAIPQDRILLNPEFAEKLNAISVSRLREKLAYCIGCSSTIKSIVRNSFPRFLYLPLQKVWNLLFSGKSTAAGGRPISRSRIFSLMKLAGCSDELFLRQQQEIMAVESSLENKDFLDFVHIHAPTLLNRES